MKKFKTTMKKTVYFHSRQIDFCYTPRQIKCLIAGRGWGKSTVIALTLYEWLRKMPRAKVFLASTTYEQIENFVLPPVREKWAELGLIENVHFVVGKRPPERWHTPYKPAKKYDRVITFWNGFTIQLLSAERINARRGGSYDAGIIDEAAFVKFAAFKSVFSASIRGNIGRFPKEVHRSLVIMSSRPRKIEQQWVYLFRELSKRKPEKVMYMEGSALDNQDALGAEWFEEQKDNMGDLEYLIEVLNQNVQELPNGFYNKYKPHVHEYTPQYDVRQKMRDIIPDQLLEVTVDYGGWFSCFEVFQEDVERNTEFCKRRYWIKEDTIDNLVDQMCKDLQGHEFKYVRIWGEPRMWDKTAKGKVVETITRAFERNQWSVDVMVPPGYRTDLQKDQYQFMLKILDEIDDTLPRFRINRDACPDVITAIRTADVLPDMRLNKSTERNRDFPQEHSTHQPQAINYYFLQKHGHRLTDDVNARAAEVDFS